MIGYHYTSWQNYQKIETQGLIPYRICKPELEVFFRDGITGIWVWSEELSRDEHLGSILWQLMTKADTKIVKLQITYHESELLTQYGSPVEILHDGRLGLWKYHSRVPAVVLTKPISTGFIALEEIYDVDSAFK